METHGPVDIRSSKTSIPIVSSYKYLGFPIKANSIEFKENLLHRRSQADGMLPSSAYISTAGNQHTVFVSIFSPSLSYLSM